MSIVKTGTVPRQRPTYLYALIAALMLVAAVPFVAVGFQTWLANESLIDQAQRSHLLLARTAADRVSYRLESLNSLVSALAGNPQLYEQPDAASAQEVLAGALLGREQVLAVATFYQDGDRDLLVQMARRPEAAWLSDKLMQGAAAELKLAADNRAILLMRPSERPGLRVVAALPAQVLEGDLQPDELTGAKLTLQARDSGSDFRLGDPVPTEVAALATNNQLKSGASRFNIHDRTLIGAFAEIPNSPWVVLSVQPAEEAEKARSQMYTAAGFAALSVLALVVLISLAGWRWLLAPMRQLLAMQRRVLGGTEGAAADDAGEFRASFARLEAMAENKDAFERVFLDRYQVIRILGHGGMGSVFRAWDPRLCRDVAIKTVRVGQSSGNDSLTLQLSLQNEAVAFARLQHPNVISVYDYLMRDEFAFIVMEFVDGGSLRDVLLRGDSELSEVETTAVAVALLRALSAAHKEGFLHRDIKPANVMISPHGQVKLGDFGVASKLSEIQAGLHNAQVGTPGYIAPECLAGSAASVRSDLYALGVVLLECLAGWEAFDRVDPLGKPIQRMLRRIRVQPAFRAWLETLLAVDPEQRPGSAAEALTQCPTVSLEQGFGALAAKVREVITVAPAELIATRVIKEEAA